MERFLLNSTVLLHRLITVSLDEVSLDDQVESSVFLTQYEQARSLPDHVAKSAWSSLTQQLQKQNMKLGPIAALRLITGKFVKNEKGGPRTDLALFSEWQTLMSRVSCLPIMACYQVFNPRPASQGYSFRWPLYPYHPAVEDYITRERLHETHQHLNGSTSAEECWLDALKHPEVTVRDFEKGWASQETKQLCAQIDTSLTPKIFKDRLQVANNIREILCRVAQDIKLPEWMASLQHPRQLVDSTILHRGKEYGFATVWPTDDKYRQESEFFWLTGLLEKWRYGAPEGLERLLWIYLLIQNQYLTLLVQRDDFFGFEQFQKYTMTELREETEKSYLSRFKHAHGAGVYSQVRYLEGRFAPKSDPSKMQKLLFSVLRGYWEYLKGHMTVDWEHPQPLNITQVLDNLEQVKPSSICAELALVPHFIKKKPKKDEVYPYALLFKDLKNQAAILMDIMKYEPRLTRWIRGVDAAANEMHAPPELFGPLFRVLAKSGIAHFTYHVGEDFPHLISGIRSIDDALRFLPLRNGDRLGHCTAIGITPNIWKRSLPLSLSMTKEARLLDLVFIWRELRSHPELLRYASDAAIEAVRLAHEVFSMEEEISINTLDQVFELRGLLAESEGLLGELDRPLKPKSLWLEEYERARELAKMAGMKRPLKLYKQWLTSDNVRKQRAEYVEVPLEYLPDEAVVSLQQVVMAKIADRNIAIECPPTSNTRISQYRDVSEHHIFRWMGLPGEAIEGDVSMSICLGSDDPGIFAADLKSEFYHLFVVLTRKFGLSPAEALRKVAEVNENGRIYRFHDVM
ncbi:adenosine deaminase [Vibrio cholerae]|uniref:adenosine deaminase n=1 Tax=Vibrio cholerae TaxID=666 RepID=UPI001664E864|nr:adenosine deaminase [Vibrio cholerae]GFK55876.1 Adenine deaminase [Vibrio cholerae]GFK59419.1 Adenine deaminase [Vibrio cholerae]GFK62964.1 Adenine deaminase [Vibrio cholerae]GFK67161.1 Adenine deaminase [Vibrio cholerae]GFK70057.1 Adenine deaminase [Vibrio cholerae]